MFEDILNPQKILSPDLQSYVNTSLKFEPKLDVTTDVTTTTNIEQGGLVNLKGQLDASTKKTALLYSPVTIISSPGASASSSPGLSQAESKPPLIDLSGALNSPLLLLGGGLLLAFFVFGVKK